MKKKKIKKVFIIIGSVFLSLVLILTALFFFVVKPYTRKLAVAIDQILSDKDFMGDLLIDPPSTTESFQATDGQATEGSDENSADTQLTEGSSENTDGQGNEQTPKKPIEKYNNAYQYVKDNVDDNDFKRGLSFAQRVDVAYILGLLKGGLTVPEKKELKAYLKERFSTEEINEGVALYNKYSYLLK